MSHPCITTPFTSLQKLTYINITVNTSPALGKLTALYQKAQLTVITQAYIYYNTAPVQMEIPPHFIPYKFESRLWFKFFS